MQSPPIAVGWFPRTYLVQFQLAAVTENVLKQTVVAFQPCGLSFFGCRLVSVIFEKLFGLLQKKKFPGVSGGTNFDQSILACTFEQSVSLVDFNHFLVTL